MTYNRPIFHCECCGRVVTQEPHQLAPFCCGREMCKAGEETLTSSLVKSEVCASSGGPGGDHRDSRSRDLLQTCRM